jgi:hypothetical protein
VLSLGSSESGSLAPPLGGQSISIVYTPASGNPVTHVQTTGDDGSYQDSFRSTGPGRWHAQAHWAGNDQYLPADSPVCTLTAGPG